VTILAFSGTEPTRFADWLIDFRATHDNPDGFHDGFADAVRLVWDKVASALRTSDGVFTNRLYITGHSLGGALAVITALRLLRAKQIDVERTQVVTFGMPRAGTETFADVYRTVGLGRSTYRLVHGVDAIPMLPPYDTFGNPEVGGFRHVGNLLSCGQLKSFDLKMLVHDRPESRPPQEEVLPVAIPFNTAPDFPGAKWAQLLLIPASTPALGCLDALATL
jgi:hypothetical protein